ncbi:hypothetical protein Cme02nite_16630 [Catellatospora methionotrophica]|uniref:Uncharacterized protein n=1 Tax=Catellatospora methionotrophica TaxID=121620 RepID=A0A8J3PFK6_9ACTN|nr:hypothetical protein [Catellatospora methionotrophica]GIG13331.1 hypothetical protein Cme02nite_16630 [Catellatospora methionotrophica]
MKNHRTDSVSLFFGLIFLLVAGAFLARRVINVDLPPLGWFIAGGLIILGVLAVLGALSPRRSGDPAPVEPAPEKAETIVEAEPERVD